MSILFSRSFLTKRQTHWFAKRQTHWFAKRQTH
jgi:hypothetical protein